MGCTLDDVPELAVQMALVRDAAAMGFRWVSLARSNLVTGPKAGI
jgi:hypothetical protein